jgi:hypothetical protein
MLGLTPGTQNYMIVFRMNLLGDLTLLKRVASRIKIPASGKLPNGEKKDPSGTGIDKGT